MQGPDLLRVISGPGLGQPDVVHPRQGVGYIDKLEQMGNYARLSEADQREYHNTLALLCQTVTAATAAAPPRMAPTGPVKSAATLSALKAASAAFTPVTATAAVANAQAIAGKEGYNGLLAILNATDEDYQSLTTSINNCTGA